MNALPPRKLSQVLTEDAIFVGFTASRFDDAVPRLLIPVLERQGFGEQNIANAIRSVLNRESTGSTTVGAFAIPHARIAGLKRIAAAIATNREGIFGNDEVRVMLAFVSPAEAAADHLRFLSAAAQLMRNGEALEDILSCSTPADVLDRLIARNF